MFVKFFKYLNFGSRKPNKTHEVKSPHEEMLGAWGVGDIYR